MATDQSDDFHVRPGRVGSRGTRINPRGSLRSQPFPKQVQVAVRRAGGDGSRQPSNEELSIARYQGEYVAGLAKKLNG